MLARNIRKPQCFTSIVSHNPYNFQGDISIRYDLHIFIHVIVSIYMPSYLIKVPGWYFFLFFHFPFFPHSADAGVELPEFPLIPASKGFCITLRKTLKQFKSILESVGVSTDQKLQARELDSNLPKTAISSCSVETKVAKATCVETEKEKVVGDNS